ncbi:hypothetical protein [Paraburkholderia sp. J41]|uniref:hypothetical protein n=1 Tax=Paraburkholderia sp. J41 TaxID=2805433 RepID=UPI002AC34E09|nr:hypothetical protein [Paraburkholderia sp. J41]
MERRGKRVAENVGERRACGKTGDVSRPQKLAGPGFAAMLRWHGATRNTALARPTRQRRTKIGQKYPLAPKNPSKPREFFETLVVIGFALRYHSKRRPGKRQHGRCGESAHAHPRNAKKRRGAPGPSLLDGAARVRIIGAFALFVST